jgi:hypothetical protein
MKPIVDPKDARPWQEGRYCSMCLTEDPQLQYFADRFIPDTWFCAECWERCELQQRMVDEGLEQNPEVEN